MHPWKAGMEQAGDAWKEIIATVESKLSCDFWLLSDGFPTFCVSIPYAAHDLIWHV